ncbi:MAG: penicillin-binding transpeptidase domain-containing protein [Cellulosilyticaceae bacterium]
MTKNTTKKSKQTAKQNNRQPKKTAKQTKKPSKQSVKNTNTLKERKRRLQIRLFWVKIFLIIPVLFLLYKIGYYKIVMGEEFERRVYERMASTEREIKALRGSVLDRNNKAMITSTLVYHIILEPKVMLTQMTEEERNHTYKVLAEYTGKTEVELQKIVNDNPSSQYKILQKNISAEDMETLKKEKIKGAWFEESFIRIYPKKELGAQTLGFYNGTEGQYGVEQFYDELMTGKSGRIYPKVQDGGIVTTSVAQSKEGNTLVLTVDEVIQQYVEKVMNKYIKEYSPLNAAAVVMNPNTGEIYAMYSYPFYDPNTYTNLEKQMGSDKWNNLSGEQQSAALNHAWQNYNIQTPYETGSTLKPVIVSIALEEELIDLNSQYTCSGRSNVSGTMISCWKRTGHGIQNLEQAIANSCNSAMIQISEKIPTTLFYDYLLKFGLGKKTGIDLPSEASGLLHSRSQFGPVEKATTSMGQGPTLTTVQLLSAFSAVINGGYLLQPYVVSEVIDSKGNMVEEKLPNVKRQVISETTSDILKRYMRSTVTEGTGANAAVSGYTIAGKTGTAEKLPRGSDKYIVSFVGYAPYENPEVITIVLFDEVPETAGVPTKAFNEMMQNILPYLGIEASAQDEVITPTTTTVPSIENLNLYEGIKALENAQLEYEIVGVGTSIKTQYPAPGIKLPLDSKVKIYAETTSPETIAVVPDLIGKTIDEAKALVDGMFKIEGSGTKKIVKQIPYSDSKIEKGNKIIVQTLAE